MTNIANLKDLFQGYAVLHDDTVVLFSVGTPNQLAGQARTISGLNIACRRDYGVMSYLPAHIRKLLDGAPLDEQWYKRIYAVPIVQQGWMPGAGLIETFKGLNWRWVVPREEH